jgi:thioredoxin-related protein
VIHLEIDDTEKEDLREFLRHCLNFLKVEVHHTDTRTFREGLKRKEKVIENLLDQLGSDANR